VTVQAVNRAGPRAGSLALVIIGLSAAAGTVLALTLFRPVLFVLALGGLVLLILALVIPDRKAYWMFLLVLSMLFDVGKRLTTWVVEPWEVMQVSGPPSSGSFSLDIFSTDVILFAMLLPWLVRLSLRQQRLYFPKVGYLFLL
jgi:hypothetical protein